ncbi:HAD family hydrolase [Staphylococcus sp. ACRSN]|uniref:HAD family hydrolase n=1 Tax=Staphylococcus sp. ACRSN TaxID=2918214 RepID=UPI001EF2D6E2|nr:HAD family hydrolase [Staphylococcus sp. ACRSN]MCG7338686.1 HAD family hydrolase [Staphylococcus sp. ACRSN]
MNVKLVVTDMDGTFLNDGGTFDKSSFNLLKDEMLSKGIEFVFCTGKQCERVEALVGDLAKDLYIIGDSATKIKHNNEILYKATVSNTLGQKIIKNITRIDLNQTIIACTEKSAYVLRNLDEDELKIVYGSYHHVTLIDSFDEISEDFLKITVHDPDQNCKETAKQLVEMYENVYIVASEESWIDITKKNVNKGTTINYIQKELGISVDETIAFGDGLNDIDLFSAAKFKVAMDNAYPELKQKANLIAKNNNENGVVRTLQLLLNS